jgi:hypothetical protein
VAWQCEASGPFDSRSGVLHRVGLNVVSVTSWVGLC